MTQLLGYELAGVLYESQETIVYRGRRLHDALPVLVKMLRSGRFSPHEAGRLRNEFEIGRRIKSPHVVKPLALEASENGPALVLEDSGGQPLDSLLAGPLETGLFLRLAVRAARALADVHAQGIVHKDIKPQNLIVDLATFDVKLTDFGIALSQSLEVESRHPRAIEGTLAYLSPEQTGRSNRPLDYRTDFYSLGVTFYFMLAGELPFVGRDPLEWVHAHIAREPMPLHEQWPSVPRLVSDLVAKLLAKSAEDRYQSAEGLCHDLERACREWESRGRVTPFALEEFDLSKHFRVSGRLVGRAHEVQTLIRFFTQSLGGPPALVLVGGYSGAGKSSLVNELQKPVAERRGFFARGKFDQYQRGIPLATIEQVVGDLIRQLLIESEASLQAWKRTFVEALGGNGRLLAEAFPVVELVIGPQPALPELSLAESQHRFRSAFLSFLGVFARTEHPLVLFFDDLQWADAASLNLIERALQDAARDRSLLVVGAYRANEVVAGHAPLRQLEECGVIVHEIDLGPLDEPAVGQLVADALREPAPELARHVFEKTQGNPLFVTQFLKMLHDEGQLRFDAHARRWQWDLPRLQRLACAENVVELLLLKLNKLSESSRQALRIAASAGNRAERPLLATVSGQSEAALTASLQEAVREGLLAFDGGIYYFSHDRVRQAAYQLIPAGERAAMHLSIARAWQTAWSPGEADERVFELAEQFNQGASGLREPAERRRVARLDLRAGHKALQAGAYRAAADFFGAGVARLNESADPEAWNNDYDLLYALHFARARCEWFNGQPAEADELLQGLLKRARTLAERISIFDVRVNLHTTRGEITRSVELGLEGLALLGVGLPARPDAQEVQAKLQGVREALNERPIESLLELPPMTDAAMKAGLGLLRALVTPAFFTDEKLYCLVLCHMVDLSLRFGNAEGSAAGYVFFGMILGPLFGYYAEGYRFGRLACDLVDREQLTAAKVYVYNVFGDGINFWMRHMRTDLDYLHSSFAAAVESGNLEWACYACNHIVTCRLTRGDPLPEVWRESEQRLEFVRRARFGDVVDVIVSIQRFVQNMRGFTHGFSSFDGDDFDEAAFEARLPASRMTTMVCWYWVLKLQARFLSGDFAEAFEAAERARPLLWSSLGHLQVTDYHFYRALTVAILADDAAPERQAELRRELLEQRDRFREWATNGPENFENRLALISAELARGEGRTADAMRCYDEAIASAARNGFVHNEAVACELAARFYRLQGFARIERAYLREARARYAAWGAHGKTRQLDAIHPGLADFEAQGLTKTFSASSAQFDLMAVLKASQMISGEILMPRLTDTLLRVAVQAAGAQRGWLLLNRDGDFVPAAAVGPGTDPERVPVSIINYARRTRAPVILDDLSAHSLFSGDAAFRGTAPPLAVLCLPVSRASEPEALLYLEHDSIRGAFTSERLTVLELLAGQAAISLENARLYQQSLEAVRMREEFLAVASHELRTPLTPLKLQIQTLAALSRAGNLSDSPRDRLDRLLEHSDRQITQLAQLLDNLLDVSRISTGQLHLESSALDFSDLVRQALERHRPAFAAARAPLVVSVADAAWVNGDAARLAQVIDNLFTNAARYGAGKPVEVELSRQGRRASLRVRDFGIGIARENQERIFQRFDRAQRSIRNFGGFGVGLYLTREVLKALGGSIRVESQPGEGSCFVIELPLVAEAQGSNSRPAHSGRKPGPPAGP